MSNPISRHGVCGNRCVKQLFQIQWGVVLALTLGAVEADGQRCGWKDFYDVVGVAFYSEGELKPEKGVKAELRNHLNQPVLHGEVRKRPKEYPMLGEWYSAFVMSAHAKGSDDAPPRYWLVVHHAGDELFFPLRTGSRLRACDAWIHTGAGGGMDDGPHPGLRGVNDVAFVPMRVVIPDRRDREARAELSWDEAVKRANAHWDATRTSLPSGSAGPPAAPAECLVLERVSVGHEGVVMAKSGAAVWQDTLRMRNRCNRDLAYRLDVMGPGLLGFAHDGIPRQGTMPPEVTWEVPLACRWAVEEGAIEEVSWTLRWSPTAGSAGVLDTTCHALLLGEGTTSMGGRGWGLPGAHRPAWMPAWYRIDGEDGVGQGWAWGQARTSDGLMEGAWSLRRLGSVGPPERMVYSEEVSVLAGNPSPEARLWVRMEGQWVEPYSQRMPWGWIFHAVPGCDGIQVQDEGRSAQVEWRYEGGEMPRSVNIQPVGVGDVEVISSSGTYVFQPADPIYRVRWEGERARQWGLGWEDMEGWMARFAPDLGYEERTEGDWFVDAGKRNQEELQALKRRWAQVPGVVGLDRVMRLDGSECVWSGMLDVRLVPGQEELGVKSLMGMGFGCWGGLEEGRCLTFREGGCDVEEWGWIERLYRAPGIDRVYPEWVFFPEGNE